MNQKMAFVFPGQGSQAVGMLADIAKEHPIIQKTFQEASEALGYDLFQLTQQGPLEKLNQTEFTQPALLTASVALWRLWISEKESRPTVMAGHSLGEYSALVCAEALSLIDAVKLVELRGRLMQAAVPEGIGAMAAILGLEDEVVEAVCLEAAENEVVTAANFNTVGQVVISGHKDAVLRAMELAKQKGAKRALLLPVSVPSHCLLMKPAAESLAKTLENTPFKLPLFPVIHNVDGSTRSTVAGIRQALVEQLYQSVLWVDSIRLMAKMGVTLVLECGPGAVLSGLNKRIVTTLQCQSLSSGEALCL